MKLSPRTFLIFIVATFLCAAFFFWNTQESKVIVPVLSIDFPATPRVQDWDPARANIDYQVSMAAQIFSPLLQTDRHNQLDTGWAEQFHIVNSRRITLQIRSDARLSDGSRLTAAEAAWSLKRLAFLQQEQGEGGFYVEEFCHVTILKDIHDPCPGLKASGQTLTIETLDPVAILPRLLTNLETAIVPKGALAADGLTLLDQPVTSGPYAIEGKRLRANLQHFNYHNRMPPVIALHESLDATPESLLAEFKAGAIDHVALFSAINGLQFNELKTRLGPAVNAYHSVPMGVGLFAFTPTAQEKFSIDERRTLVLRLQKATHQCLNTSPEVATRTATTVLIPNSSVGALTAEERVRYEAAREALGLVPLRQTVQINLRSQAANFHDCLARELRDMPVQFISGSNADLIYKSYGLSNAEELTFIRSLITLHMLDIGLETRGDWMRRYMAEGDAEKRVQMVKEAEFRALWVRPVIIPIWNYDVRALIRRPWTMNFSPLQTHNPLYQVRYGTED